MHGINSVKQRNFQPRLQGQRLITVDHVQPVLRRVSRVGIRAAAAQQRAQSVLGDIRNISADGLDVGLRHLADFFVERHLRQQMVHARLDVGGFRTDANGCQQNPQNHPGQKFSLHKHQSWYPWSHCEPIASRFRCGHQNSPPANTRVHSGAVSLRSAVDTARIEC